MIVSLIKKYKFSGLVLHHQLARRCLICISTFDQTLFFFLRNVTLYLLIYIKCFDIVQSIMPNVLSSPITISFIITATSRTLITLIHFPLISLLLYSISIYITFSRRTSFQHLNPYPFHHLPSISPSCHLPPSTCGSAGSQNPS